MSLARKRILVTGGAGFIGSYVVEGLLRRNNHVIVFDNFRSGSLENLQDAKNCKKGKLEIIEGDIRSIPALERACKGVDVVYHLAVEPLTLGLEDPLVVDQVNSTGTLNTLYVAHRSGVQRFNYISSSEVYGTAQKVPMAEDHPLIPRTVYASSKLAGEAYLIGYHNNYGLNYSIIRPFNSYGPRHRDDGYCAVLFRFFQRITKGQPLLVHGDGNQTRDMSYVEDTARGIVLAGESKKLLNNEVNIGTGREISINEIANKVLRVLKSNLKVEHTSPRPGDVRRHLANVRKAKKILGFTPLYSFEEGLKKTWDWYSKKLLTT